MFWCKNILQNDHCIKPIYIHHHIQACIFFFFVRRDFKIYSLSNFSNTQYSIINYGHHVVCYSPMAYLLSKQMFVPFSFFDKYCCMWIWCLGQWQPPCDHEGRHHWHSKDGRAESGKHLGPSIQSSRSVVSDSLQPHESQHTRPPCPSPTPGAYSNSCPSSWWCHPAISSSVIPFSSCPQSPPASGSFPMSQLFSWGGQSIGVSASAPVLPMNTQDWSPLGWTGWISLQSKGLVRVFSNTTVQKHQFFSAQLSSQSNSHIHTCLGP